jgi:flagellar biosynthetic protein FliR
MSIASTLAGNACLFALVASRIAGFVVVSPFPGQNVSNTQRVGLVVVLAWVASSFAPGVEAFGSIGLRLAGWAALEIGCGLIIGMAFRFVFAATEVLGSLLGIASGLGTPSVFNPTLEATETPIGRVVGLLGMLVALGIGAHRVALGALLDSFRALPVGTITSIDAPFMAFADLAIDAFVVGVRLATPVIAVALIVNVALAMISRAAPSLQIFSVGFGILIASTTLTLLASLGDITAGLSAHFNQLGSTLDATLSAVRR